MFSNPKYLSNSSKKSIVQKLSYFLNVTFFGTPCSSNCTSCDTTYILSSDDEDNNSPETLLKLCSLKISSLISKVTDIKKLNIPTHLKPKIKYNFYCTHFHNC